MLQAVGANLVYSDHGREVYACRDLNVTIEPNEFVGVLGPSGSGKSSLLYLLSGLKQPSSGAILYEGQDMTKMTDQGRANLRLREFGFIFQSPFLLGYLTALENIILSAGGKRTKESVDQGREFLHALGISDLEGRFPHEMSGGQKQRVCVARALLANPKVIFADEPTAALDHTNGIHVVELLNEHRGTGSLVMVTHDETMLASATRILRIEDGRVV